MKAQIKTIELHTENFGTLTFTKHFNAPNTEAVDALFCFVSNNWEKLGDFHFVTVLLWEDDTNTTVTFEGMNAEANLCEFIETL